MWPTLFKIPWLHLPIRGYGLMLMIGFLGGTWWAAKRAARVKCDPDLVVNLGFVALISSIVGARLFYVVHYWDDHFAGRGVWTIVNISAGGLEFYGGLLGALAGCLVYIRLKGQSLRLYLDILTPSLMFGMGMARIGCFLNGCCWGGACPPEIPWAVRFPYASPAFYRQWEERRITVPAELIYIGPSGLASPIPRDLLTMSPEERYSARLAFERADEAFKHAQARQADPKTLAKLARARELALEQRKKIGLTIAPFTTQAERFDLTASELENLANAAAHRSLAVHPVQLYASIDGFLLAVVLSAYFHRRRRHGMVFAWMLMLYPLMRIMEEIIRGDNPYDTAGLTVSQFVSLLLAAVGVALMIALRRMPLRSPRAVPYVPPPLEPEPAGRRKTR